MTDDVVDVINPWVMWLTGIAGLLAMVAALFRWVIAVHYAAWHLSLQRMEELDVGDGDFVARNHLERELSVALNDPYSKTVVVYGQMGNGKSSLIQHSLRGRGGVLSVTIVGGDTEEQVIKQILNHLPSFGGVEKTDFFFEDVLAACRVPPTIVISLDVRCTGQAFEAVMLMCKSLSYEKAKDMTSRGRQARFVIDISGTRAITECGIKFDDLRTVGVHVGPFSHEEALDYATPRMPNSFGDKLCREDIAGSVAEKFDGCVATLQEVCYALRTLQPTNKKAAEDLIENELELQDKEALQGWRYFCKELAKELGTPVPSDNLSKVVLLLLAGPQKAVTITRILEQGTKMMLSTRDLDLLNANAGHHPLTIDPCGTTICLSGKRVESVLRKNYSFKASA